MPGEPIYGEAFGLSVPLVARASRPDFKANPTIAAGDFKISKDGGAFSNLATLPVVSPAGGVSVSIVLSATEMTANEIVVQGIDADGAEWDDVFINIIPAAQYAEPTGVPAATSTLKDKVNWLFMLSRNRRTTNGITEIVYADNGTTVVATGTKGDAGGVFARGKYQ